MSHKADHSLFEVIKAKTETMSRSEKRVARTILADYPAAGLQTVAELAKSSNVSSQTVIRFVASLEFESYPALQGRLIEELKVRTDAPFSRHTKRRTALVEDNLLGRCQEAWSLNMEETFARLPEAELVDAARLLCDVKRPLIATGGRTSELLAQYIVLQLQQMRANVTFVAMDAVSRSKALLDLTNKAVVIIYDFHRYSDTSLQFAEFVHDRGAQIILITDPLLSPVSKFAHVVLPVQVGFLTPFDSQLCGMAVTEALVAATTKELEQGFGSRMEMYEKYRSCL